MVVQGRGERGLPKKTWMDFVNDDIRERAVSGVITADRRERNKKFAMRTPPSGIRW